MNRQYFWFLHPRSFLGLVIAGFLFVALPLIVAIITGAFYIERMSKQSEEAVYRAVQATQTTREILAQVATEERTIRQFLVLRDPMFLQGYLDSHILYSEKSERLNFLLVDSNLRARLEYLNQIENQLYLKIQYFVQESVDESQADGFIELTEKANILLDDTNQLINSEMMILQEMSDEAQRIIYWELSAILPLAVIIIAIFAVLLSRPVKQIEHAIRNLGSGSFNEAVTVDGPNDIRYLGERLEWLRLRLKYLEDKKVKFLSYVSHELKTPLTSIREGAELLAEGVIGPLTPHQKEVTHILKKSSISLQKMIEKLLSFNMPGRASLSSERRQVSISRTIETVIADHKPVIMAKKLDVAISGTDVKAYGDEEQLRVIADNLLSNAIKYSPETGRIIFAVSEQTDSFTLDVQDEGPGISPDEADKVFEAYYSGPKPNKGLIRGSGLGLSIVREFVEAHHGTIELVNTGKEKGAHFRVRLPLHRTEVQQEKELAWAV